MATQALLDTHTLLWFLRGDARLSHAARAVIEPPDNPMRISIASLWEIAIKVSLGKLALERPFSEFIPEQLERERIEILGISLAHLARLTNLPFHHRDPFDRLIVAQALSEDLPIVSVDRAFDSYGVRRIW